MKRFRWTGTVGCVLGAAVASLPGCTNPFLGLDDYQRDLLSGLIAAALLGQTLADLDGTGAPVDGRDGEDGLNCWDLNGDATPDEAEDINGDGAFDALDCRGQGADGADGQDGADGLRCWDRNGNAIADPEEDRNGDGFITLLDCAGEAGADGAGGGAGPRGPSGLAGDDGPAFFNIFVDDFFTAGDGIFDDQLEIVLVSINEPALGATNAEPGMSDAVACRVAIPDSYDAGNDVSLRIYFYRTGIPDEDCFIFTIDAVRAREGGSVEAYGQRRWVRIDPPAGHLQTPAMLLAVDLPINTLAGLGYPADLADGDFLAFELATHQPDGAVYEILGVEFSEAAPGTAPRSGGTVFTSGDPEAEDGARCEIIDCNHNGISDERDILDGTSADCDGNGVPDECAACPPLDVVFVMDTSGSMRDEAIALCSSIGAIVTELAGRGIALEYEILAISPNDTADLPPCVTSLAQSVDARFGTQVPGDNGACPADLRDPGNGDNFEKAENWASATAIVAARQEWLPDALRVVVPMSDEGPCLGDPCEDPGADRDAVENAIAVANANDVVISPVAASGSSACVTELAMDLALGTGGHFEESEDLESELADRIATLVTEVCRSASDCDGNGAPDVCELDGRDCNGNGVLDDCEAGNACADGDPCTVDICDGACQHLPLCPGPCVDGVCLDCLTDADCGDQNVCTTDTCVGGECTHQLVVCPEGGECDPVSGCMVPP